MAISTVLALGIIGMAAYFLTGGFPAPVISSTVTSTIKLPPIKHVIVIIIENEGYASVISSGSAPYQNLLASRYSIASNYRAIGHPSLPNYIALVAGNTFGITSDCLPSQCPLNYTTITNLIDAKNLSWKEYAESMPTNCFQVNSADGLYAPKHNPFVYFENITGNDGYGNVSSYCKAHDVSFSQFSKDLQANALPNYSFITPNLCNDAHSCPLAVADAWLATLVPKIINSSSFSSTALFITYDEGNINSSENRVPLILVSPFAKQGYESQVSYMHYSLLATIENLLWLGNLGRNDKTANVMSDMFTNQSAV